MHGQALCRAARRIGAKVNSLIIGSVVCGLFLPALAQNQSATEVLKQADQFADQGDWFRAGPLYAEAEEQFRTAGDRRNEIYAKLGRLHRDAETGGYRSVRQQISEMLGDPTVAGDPQLKIRALSKLGSIDLNLDTSAAEQDWNEVLCIATAEKDAKWENRARGQLALVAGVNGDIGSSGVALYQAIGKAAEISDIAGVVHFSTWLAKRPVCQRHAGSGAAAFGEGRRHLSPGRAGHSLSDDDCKDPSNSGVA